MLKNGSYPYFLKKRILGDRGHLSNKDCARAVSEAVAKGVKSVLLGHLSEENNSPSIAYECVNLALGQSGACEGRDYVLSVAPGAYCCKPCYY